MQRRKLKFLLLFYSVKETVWKLVNPILKVKRFAAPMDFAIVVFLSHVMIRLLYLITYNNKVIFEIFNLDNLYVDNVTLC